MLGLFVFACTFFVRADAWSDIEDILDMSISYPTLAKFCEFNDVASRYEDCEGTYGRLEDKVMPKVGKIVKKIDQRVNTYEEKVHIMKALIRKLDTIKSGAKTLKKFLIELIEQELVLSLMETQYDKCQELDPIKDEGLRRLFECNGEISHSNTVDLTWIREAMPSTIEEGDSNVYVGEYKLKNNNKDTMTLEQLTVYVVEDYYDRGASFTQAKGIVKEVKMYMDGQNTYGEKALFTDGKYSDAIWSLEQSKSLAPGESVNIKIYTSFYDKIDLDSFVLELSIGGLSSSNANSNAGISDGVFTDKIKVKKAHDEDQEIIVKRIDNYQYHTNAANLMEGMRRGDILYAGEIINNGDKDVLLQDEMIFKAVKTYHGNLNNLRNIKLYMGGNRRYHENPVVALISNVGSDGKFEMDLERGEYRVPRGEKVYFHLMMNVENGYVEGSYSEAQLGIDYSDATEFELIDSNQEVREEVYETHSTRKVLKQEIKVSNSKQTEVTAHIGQDEVYIGSFELENLVNEDIELENLSFILGDRNDASILNRSVELELRRGSQRIAVGDWDGHIVNFDTNINLREGSEESFTLFADIDEDDSLVGRKMEFWLHEIEGEGMETGYERDNKVGYVHTRPVTFVRADQGEDELPDLLIDSLFVTFGGGDQSVQIGGSVKNIGGDIPGTQGKLALNCIFLDAPQSGFFLDEHIYISESKLSGTGTNKISFFNSYFSDQDLIEEMLEHESDGIRCVVDANRKIAEMDELNNWKDAVITL